MKLHAHYFVAEVAIWIGFLDKCKLLRARLAKGDWVDGLYKNENTSMATENGMD